jgi:hypothetical protein
VPQALDGFVDSLLQGFENCRPGLTDETLAKGIPAVSPFFLELYEKEIPRLRDTIRVSEPHLSPGALQELFAQVDDLVRKVVIPAYSRQAVRFTRSERNGFYAMPEPLHTLERLLLAAGGMALGAFIVWAPFVPLWEKYWIALFSLAGLFVPELRRFLGTRRYESELNALVARADLEIGRIDTAYLTDGEALAERGSHDEAARRRRLQDIDQGGT